MHNCPTIKNIFYYIPQLSAGGISKDSHSNTYVSTAVLRHLAV